MSSSDMREEEIWQIGGELNLPSEADEGGRFCHAIRAVGTHTTRLQRVKEVIIGISYIIALC